MEEITSELKQDHTGTGNTQINMTFESRYVLVKLFVKSALRAYIHSKRLFCWALLGGGGLVVCRIIGWNFGFGRAIIAFENFQVHAGLTCCLIKTVSK